MNRPLVLCLLGLGACAGATANLPTQQVALPSPAAASLPGEVVVTKVVEARPAAMRASRAPGQDLRYSVLMIGPSGGAFVNGRRVEGQTLIAGDKIRIGASSDPLVALGEWARALSGAARVIEAPRSLAAISGQGFGVSDGTVIIPVLDELDVVQLSSENSMAGGSSSETSRTSDTVTTRSTSGAASASSSTPTYANARMRLLVLRLAGGVVKSQRVVYGRGAAEKLEGAISAMGAGLTAGLQALDDTGVPPTPPAPDPTTPPATDPTTPPATDPTAPPAADPATPPATTPTTPPATAPTTAPATAPTTPPTEAR